MVNTRGPRHRDNSSLDEYVQNLKHQLQRSEEKIQIIIEWIRENFGETNSLFNDLWKILRHFDEGFSKTFSKTNGAGNERNRPDTEAEVKVPSEGGSMIPRTVKSASKLYNSGKLEKYSIQPTRMEKKLGKTAYVLVEHLDLGVATLSKLPQRCAPKRNNSSKIQEKTGRPCRERKQSFKLRSAESSGHGVDNPFTLSYDKVKVEEEETIMDANGSDDQDDASNEAADPLRLSNPNSSDLGSDYERSRDQDHEIGPMSEDSNSNTSFVKISSLNRSQSPDNSGHDSVQLPAPFLFTSTHCDSGFTTSFDFVTHQLLYDNEEESKNTSTAVLIQSCPPEVELFKPEENGMMNQTTGKECKKLGVPRRRRRHFKTMNATTQERDNSNNEDVIGSKETIKRRRRFKIVKELRLAEEGVSAKNESRKSGRPKSSCKRKRPSICEICGKMLKSLGSLRTHISAIHELWVQSFPCPKCDKVMRHKGSLKIHLQLHDPGAKCHLCSICRQAFARASTLARHMKTHFDVRSFNLSAHIVTKHLN